MIGAGATALGADGARVAVAGDSAGGCLSAVLAQDARDAGIPLRHQMLIQPCVSTKTFWWSSARQNGEGPLLTTRLMMWFWREYLSTPEDSLNPRACPLEAKSLAGTCPATVITGELDLLRDEGKAYFDLLRESGVEAKHLHYTGVPHGFYGVPGLPHASECLEAISEALVAALR